MLFLINLVLANEYSFRKYSHVKNFYQGLIPTWYNSKKAVLFDKREISQYPKETLHYKQRPKSLKRDYRPSPYAGTNTELTYFKYHQKERKQAHYRCLEDFATRWIRLESKNKVFANARLWLNDLVQEKGEEVLYTHRTNVDFIHKIGGIPHSFNYRENWPKKSDSYYEKNRFSGINKRDGLRKQDL